MWRNAIFASIAMSLCATSFSSPRTIKEIDHSFCKRLKIATIKELAAVEIRKFNLPGSDSLIEKLSFYGAKQWNTSDMLSLQKMFNESSGKPDYYGWITLGMSYDPESEIGFYSSVRYTRYNRPTVYEIGIVYKRLSHTSIEDRGKLASCYFQSKY